jgi:hypothetical protein
MLDSFADKVVVPGHVKDGARHPRVGQLDHGLGAERRQERVGLDLEEVPEEPEGVRGVRPESELGVPVRRRLLQQAVPSEGNRLAEEKILKENWKHEYLNAEKSKKEKT